MCQNVSHYGFGNIFADNLLTRKNYNKNLKKNKA